MPESIEFYLSRGCDEKTAAYFASGRRSIVSVKANDDFTLTLNFDNGEIRLLDVKPIIEKGGVFIHLKDKNRFLHVYLDECRYVSWDINPQIDSKVYLLNRINLGSDSCYINSVPLRS